MTSVNVARSLHASYRTPRPADALCHPGPGADAMLSIETCDRPEAATEEWLRLSVRIVVTGRSAANSKAMLQQVLALFWPTAELYDFYTTPYPKLAEATV